MNAPTRWSRILLIVGLVVMLVGTVDPMEGSVLILLGIGLVAVSTHLDHSRYRKLFYWSFALALVGVSTLWIASAFGGIRTPGDPPGTGHSMGWGLLLIPYPVGWIMGLVGVILRFRESRKLPAQPQAAVQ